MDIIRLYVDLSNGTISLAVSPWLVVLIVVVAGAIPLVGRHLRRYGLVSLNISLGNIGTAEFRPNREDLQIAHRIWTELVTRKAAVRIDPANDVIVEVYDSWYALFGQVRALIANLPADLVRKEKSTKEIVRIATTTLNSGLRPHLTKWQARFRNWYAAEKDQLAKMSPQDLQKKFPEYATLVAEMMDINDSMIAYAAELKKIVSK